MIAKVRFQLNEVLLEGVVDGVDQLVADGDGQVKLHPQLLADRLRRLRAPVEFGQRVAEVFRDGDFGCASEVASGSPEDFCLLFLVLSRVAEVAAVHGPVVRVVAVKAEVDVFVEIVEKALDLDPEVFRIGGRARQDVEVTVTPSPNGLAELE